MFSGSIKPVINGINAHPLAGKHRWKAYAKFAGWQLRQLLHPGLTKVPFVSGTFLMAKKGMTGATGNIYCGLHEFNDMAFLLHFLRAEDTFADIGANIGSYTVLASGVCGAATLSIEPVPQTFHFLKNNIAVNEIEGLVTAFNIAAGEKKEKILFTASLDTVNHAVADNEKEAGETISVDVMPFDDLVENKEIRLVKIDAEGFETAVLAGMNRVLESSALKAIIIELNGSGLRYGYDDESIHRKLLGFGFKPYSYDAFQRKITEEQSFGAYNTIYIKDIVFAEQRIKSAVKIKLFGESF
jgi:FkbM family methyltransferase